MVAFKIVVGLLRNCRLGLRFPLEREEFAGCNRIDDATRSCNGAHEHRIFERAKVLAGRQQHLVRCDTCAFKR